jgi:hypothetical protein
VRRATASHCSVRPNLNECIGRSSTGGMEGTEKPPLWPLVYKPVIRPCDRWRAPSPLITPLLGDSEISSKCLIHLLGSHSVEYGVGHPRQGLLNCVNLHGSVINGYLSMVYGEGWKALHKWHEVRQVSDYIPYGRPPSSSPVNLFDQVLINQLFYGCCFGATPFSQNYVSEV